MAKYLHIEIPQPCSEEWNNMHSSIGGRFCDSCRKTVIDFSEMSDEQLLNFFKKKNTDVCGRFYTDQLERDIPLPVKKIPWLKYFFQVSLPALLFSYKGHAQDMLKNTAAITLAEKKPLQPVIQGAITVNGRVSNFESGPVVGATVMIQGTDKFVITDSNGVFMIRLAEKERLLEITAIGYEKQLVPVTGTSADVRLNIATLENVVIASSTSGTIRHYIAGGSIAVSVNNIFSKKETKLTVSTNPVDVELFPNPVKRNGVLTIRWKKPTGNDQQIILFNAAGIKMLEKTIHVNHSLYQEQLKLDIHAAGYYIVNIIDLKTNSKQVVSVVVE